MLTVASPLTACCFLSTSHGSTPRHLVPAAEAAEVPRCSGQALEKRVCLLSSLTFLEAQKLSPCYSQRRKGYENHLEGAP